MKTLLLLLAAISAAPFALAAEEGDKAGNGGNVVLCQDPAGKVTSVKLLDYYEAETIWGFQLDLGDPQLDPLVKVQRVLERVRRFHPITAEALAARAAGFFDDALLLSKVELTPVEDSGQYFLPVGCQLKQIAVQRPKEFPQDKTFLLNGDIWNLLDNNQRAGLILHEIVYEKLLHSKPPLVLPGHPAPGAGSRPARYFNALASSAGYPQLTAEQIVPLLQDLWFLTDLSYQGTLLTQVEYTSSGGLYGHVPKGTPATLRFAGRDTLLAPGSQGHWRDGVLLRASPAAVMPFSQAGQTLEAAAGTPVSLYKDGTLEQISLASDATIQTKDRAIPVRAGTSLSYNPNGSVSSLVPARELLWTPAGGKVWTGIKRSVQFRDDGSLSGIMCPSPAHEIHLAKADGRQFTCAKLKCQWSSGESQPWPDFITLDSAGKLAQVQSFPSGSPCR